MPVVTEKQLEILQHATAWPECYRNCFITDKGTSDYPHVQALVEAGLMINHGNPGWLCGDYYAVTEQGLEVLRGQNNEKDRFTNNR